MLSKSSAVIDLNLVKTTSFGGAFISYDDFNTALAIATLFDTVRAVNGWINSASFVKNETSMAIARAAREIGITERMIGYKIKKYSIKKEVTKDSN